MAYDETLAERVRDELTPLPDLNEIKMFGGLCFTLKGNMCVGILNGDLMVRVEPSKHDAYLGEPGAREMDFTGRTMRGFLLVEPAATADDAHLRAWIDRAREYVEPMPPKVKKAKRRQRA